MNRNRRFVVYTPSYDDSVGGIIALHCLCDQLNKNGFESCLYTMRGELDDVPYLTRIKTYIKTLFPYLVTKRFKSPIHLDTPICNKIDRDNDIIIYPEIIKGNPLKAKHVVRWLLYKHDYKNSNNGYCSNDLIFYYQKAFSPSNIENSIGGELKVMYVNPLYENKGYSARQGSCYILRKGKGRKIQHDLSNSVLIDDLSHEEISEIFNSVKVCVSYDLYTMYSRYAALCGCLSIVIPEKGLTKKEWRPEEDLRLGIAYGFDDTEWALSTQSKVKSALNAQQDHINKKSIKNFVRKCSQHFKD